MRGFLSIVRLAPVMESRPVRFRSKFVLPLAVGRPLVSRCAVQSKSLVCELTEHTSDLRLPARPPWARPLRGCGPRVPGSRVRPLSCSLFVVTPQGVHIMSVLVRPPRHDISCLLCWSWSNSRWCSQGRALGSISPAKKRIYLPLAALAQPKYTWRWRKREI